MAKKASKKATKKTAKKPASSSKVDKLAKEITRLESELIEKRTELARTRAATTPSLPAVAKPADPGSSRRPDAGF